MIFTYDKNSVDTQTEILMSVADLRDLLQGVALQNLQMREQEVNKILEGVSRKNRFPNGTFKITNGENAYDRR